MDLRAYEELLLREYRNKQKRMLRIRQLHRRIFLVVLTAVLVLLLTVSYHAILSEATTNDKDISFKYYTSIEIQHGDSLWTLAKEYAGEEYASAEDYIHEVMQINHMREETLIAGQYLIIPYYSNIFK